MAKWQGGNFSKSFAILPPCPLAILLPPSDLCPDNSKGDTAQREKYQEQIVFDRLVNP
jgi:hypothetical protein